MMAGMTRSMAAWWVVLATAAGAAAQEIDVSLAPAAGQEVSSPYRAAALVIDNRSDAEITSVRLRWAEGGPTFLHRLRVAPHTRQELRVLLPAVSVAQEYRVALAMESEGVAERACVVHWPAESLNLDAMIDAELCGRWEFSQPPWPASLLRNVLLAGLACAAALAGALLIRRRLARAAALLAGSAALTGAALLVLRAEPIVVLPDTSDPSVLAVACRRTTTWTGPADLALVYPSLRDLRDNETVVDVGREIRVPMKPMDVRVFRKTGTRNKEPGTRNVGKIARFLLRVPSSLVPGYGERRNTEQGNPVFQLSDSGSSSGALARRPASDQASTYGVGSWRRSRWIVRIRRPRCRASTQPSSTTASPSSTMLTYARRTSPSRVGSSVSSAARPVASTIITPSATMMTDSPATVTTKLAVRRPLAGRSMSMGRSPGG